MRVYEYGDPKAEIVLIQPTGAHELADWKAKLRRLAGLTGDLFLVSCVSGK